MPVKLSFVNDISPNGNFKLLLIAVIVACDFFHESLINLDN